MFFDYDKKYLLRKMKAAQNYSEKIHLEWIYCQIGQGPNNTFGVYWSCKCSDPHLTGFGSDEHYKIFHKDKLVNKSSAHGFMSEQIFFASQFFKGANFVYYDISSNKAYSIKYPQREWVEIKPRNYVCINCGQTHIEDGYLLCEEYSHPICTECNKVMKLSDGMKLI